MKALKSNRLFFAALFAMAAESQSQALRCDLIQSTAACFDLDTLRGKTITVPSNVTRLENEGIQLCQKSGQQGGNADIAYVYDNSGSMAVSRYFINGTDTLFYYGTGGCTNAGNGQPTMTIQVWNAAGTALVNQTVTRLASNAGCTNYSGDPFNARGRAYRLGMTYQAQQAPQSMAGILSFTSTVANIRRPLTLSPANLATQLAGISAISNGGTNYTVALDTSRAWLTTAITPQTPGRSKAIIFLSDGRPDNTSYLPLSSATTPPIYGIFLGRDTVGTGRLIEMATLTNGRFYLIPPNRPDSLNTVISQILNIILVQQNPQALTVTNTLINQTSTATLTFDSTTNPDVWRVRLDSIIGLRSGVTNTMRFVSSFQEIRGGVPTTVIVDTISFGLSTTGAAASGNGNISNTTFSTRCTPLSRLQWQAIATTATTTAGAKPAFFTEADSNNIRAQLRAADGTLNSVTAALSTKRPTADAEAGNLPRLSLWADSALFSGSVFTRASATATGSNSVLEPFFFDSLIASWVHPRDPQDFALDTVRFQSANKTSVARFAATPGGAAVALFPNTTTQVCMVVEDNRRNPASIYQTTMTSSVGGNDQLMRVFPAPPDAQVSAGIFTFSVCASIDRGGVKSTGDSSLQVSVIGDSLRAMYRDPVYGDSAVAVALFQISQEEPANLEFTNNLYAPVVGNSPANPWLLSQTPVYLRYQDDVGIPALGDQTAQLTVRSLKSGVQTAVDNETLTLPVATAQTLSVTRREWRGNIPLAEALAPLAANGTLQGAWLVEITAIVQTHTNTGAASGPDTAILYAANPNLVTPSLTFIDSVNATTPEGPVDVQFTLADQDFVTTSTADSLLATALCPASGDSVSGIRFNQVSPGNYTSEWLLRDGSVAPNFTNRILSCPAGGDLTLRYVDPVYGTVYNFTVPEAAMPDATPATSSFVSQTSVALSSTTPGSAISYTVNSSLPRPGQPTVYAGAIPLIATTTLKAVASATGYLRSRIMTEVYTRTPLPSRILILDSLGNAPANKTITDAATRLQIRVETSQGGLTTVVAAVISRSRGDTEGPTLGNHVFTNNTTHSFTNSIPMTGNAGAANASNGTLETGFRDTLIATWTNPTDPSDVVRDTIYVVPAFAPSTVYFSATLGGTAVTQYAAGTTTGYVVVNARTLSGAYSILVTSSINGADAETYPLTLVSPGVYSVAVPININVKTLADGTIQVFPAGDQLQARFIHPVFLDTSYGNAGYDQAPQTTARIQFLDTTGLVLPQDALFSPANNRLIVRYYDDWSAPIDGNADVNPKSLRFLLNAYRGTALIGTDRDTVNLTYNGTGLYWEGIYPLRDRALLSGNDTVESQFRGLLSATASAHNNAGVADGNTVEARLVIAYPDQNATLQITAAGGGAVSRATPAIAITLNDQAHTRLPGAQVAVSVSCLGSTDRQDTLWLTGNGAGVYTVASHPKDEQLTGIPVFNNGALACRASDSIRVSYVDPVFGTTASVTVGWTEPTGVTLRFAAASDSSTITSVSDTVASRFLAIAEGSSPTRNLVDTLYIQLTTPQGELETFPAVETAVNSGVFIASLPFAFATIAPVTGNGTVNVQRSATTAATSVVGTGLVRLGTDSAQAQIALLSVEEPASMTFTDASYNPLLGNSRINPWPLTQSPVYLRYRDDNGTPAIGPITVRFAVRSIKAGVTVGSENDSLSMTSTVFVTQTLKEWRGSIPLAEALAAVNNNGILQGAWMVEIIATVQSHGNMGASTGPLLDTLYAANQNANASITFIDRNNAVTPEGPVDVQIILRDQDFVANSTADSLLVTVICQSSGDSVTGVRFSQDSAGVYRSEWVSRNNAAPSAADRILSCPASPGGEGLFVRYVDPVYDTTGGLWTIPETARPQANPGSVSFPSQIQVALSDATPGSSINFSVDNSVPVAGAAASTYRAPIDLLATTTLKAVGSAPGYLRSTVLTEVYTRAPLPSRITILDMNGNPIPGRQITDAATALQIRVETSQGGLSTVSSILRARARGDLDTLVISSRVYTGSLNIYSAPIALKGGATTFAIGNDTLETRLPDTLIAVWRNPVDTNDIVADTVIIVPAQTPSSIHFSATAGGPPMFTGEYPAGTTTAYVVVTTRSLPGLTYRVLVASSTGSQDSAYFTLTEIAGRPGVFSAPIPLDPSRPKTGGNFIIEVLNSGDQLRATFISPVFGPPSISAFAGYGQAPQQPGVLTFLDTLGQPIANGALFSPANRRVILSYTDDWSAQINGLPNINPKQLTLRLEAYNRTTLLGIDSESVNLVYDTVTSTWRGVYPLRDKALRLDNDTVESLFRGELSATVASHDNSGAGDGAANANIVIGYPDSTAIITVRDTSGNPVGRFTDHVDIFIKDQAHTLVPNVRITAQVTCEATGDIETVNLVGDGAGGYDISPPLPKNETPPNTVRSGDSVLTCRDADAIVVTYIDPVFGTNSVVRVVWTVSTTMALRYESLGSTPITAINYGSSNRFVAVVTAATLTQNVRDTLVLTFTTPQGENEIFRLVETGVASGIYVDTIAFAYTSDNIRTRNDTLNAQIVTSSAANSVIATGRVIRGTDTAQAAITLNSNYNRSQRGYVRDQNGDGAADQVVLVFERKLTGTPASLDSLYWASEGANRRSASGSNLTLSADSLSLIANLSPAFPQNLTGIPNGARPPLALLPNDAYFGGNDVTLEDGVGPVPVNARKNPSNLKADAQGNFPPDTLYLTVSEKINALRSFDSAFTFTTTTCSDTASPHLPIPTLSIQQTSDTTFTLIVSNVPGTRVPLAHNCVYLDRGGRITDISDNVPGKRGVELGGNDPTLVLRDMLGYPSVVPGDGNFGTSNPTGDPRYIVTGGVLQWVAPADWNTQFQNGVYNPDTRFTIRDSVNPNLVETGSGSTRSDFPSGISSLLIITSSRYIAHINIYDHFGHWVRTMHQAFGFQGEMNNVNRRTNNGVMSWLVWDNMDDKGQKAGQGVYVWKVTFELLDNKQEVRITRTGLLRGR